MKPYYEQDGIKIFHGDCRDILADLDPVDAVVADPPYGDTSLAWDIPVREWLDLLQVSSRGSVWCFGSMRAFLSMGAELGGWKLAQDIVWEKHNGSGIHTDRFRRVHEHVIHLYRGAWESIYKSPVMTKDALRKTVRRKQKPPHLGRIEGAYFLSEDGGPRLMRSVIRARSCHGYALHPTQKPIELVAPLLEYSVPRGGLVLDPFIGSGTVLCAAKGLGRRAIGIELEEEYCEIAARRLAQEVLDFK